MTAATLDALSGGRMILGLGTSGDRVIEHWYGEKLSKPIQRTKEYAEIINLILSGEKLFYDGQIFKLQRGFRLLFEPVRKHIPIYIASISPKSMQSLGAVADGWMPIYWPKSKFMDGKKMIAHREMGHGGGPCMLHNPSYDFNDELLPLGATFWVRLAEQWLGRERAAGARG